MSVVGGLWLVAGAVAGVLHARFLWSSLQRQRGPVYAPLRLLAVVVFLGLAIFAKGWLAAVGWGVGFFAGVLWRVRPRGGRS